MQLKKLLAAGVATAMAVSILATGASAGSGSWSITGGQYGGTLSGNSSTSTKVLTGSVKTRIVQATSSVTSAAPNLHSSVIGRVNSTTVMSAGKTVQDSASYRAEASNMNYVNSTVTGTGYHNVWSATLTEKERQTQF